MQVDNDHVITIHYTLKDDDGKTLESSVDDEPMTYLHGHSNIIPGLEAALAGKSVDDDVSVRIAPEDAYGVRDDELQQKVPKEMFEGQEINVGATFHAQDTNGKHIHVTVLEVENDGVVIDANHPMAGMHLNFEVKITGVRAANEEELEHGHVHGPGGHHH